MTRKPQSGNRLGLSLVRAKRKVVRSYPDGLPSDENLKAKLQLDRGFTEDAAANFVRVFHATIEFAKLKDASYDSAKDTIVMPPAEGQAVPDSSPEPTTPQGATAPRPPAAPGLALGPGVQRYSMSFGKDAKQNVAVYSTQPMTQKQINVLIKYLEVAREGLTQDEDSDAAEAPSS